MFEEIYEIYVYTRQSPPPFIMNGTKKSHSKAQWRNILFSNLATGHFSEKLFRNGPPPGQTGSNDTGLITVSGPGTEPIKVQTDRHF